MQQQSNNQAPKMSKVIASSAEGYPLLGNCIYWSFSDMKMPRDRFVAMLNDLGIDPNIAPETRAKSALVKSLKAVTKEQGKSHFHRKVVDDRDLASFAIVNTEIDTANQDVNFQTETKVRFEKKGQFAVIEGSDEAREKILSSMRDYQSSYTTDQIRSSILRFIYDVCKGVMIRENGGIYFVPANYMEEFKKLQNLFETLAEVGACSVETIPVIDTSDAKKAMWKALVSEARADMKDMRKDIDDMTEGMNQRAQERRLEKFKDLRSKIEMYEILLSGTAKELTSELSDIEKAFREKLGA